jgi:Tol biopolymer transport system component
VRPDPRPFVATATDERNPSLSLDGRFLAYSSNESGRDEIYVQTFPDGDQRFTVSVEGGSHPRWSGSGDELFYVEGNTLMSVAVSKEPDFSTGAPQRLFSGDEIQAELVAYGDRTYDVAADGQRFLVVRRVIEGEPRVTAIQNWPALLRERDE